MVRGEFEAFVVSSANYWHGLRNKGRRNEQVANSNPKRKSKHAVNKKALITIFYFSLGFSFLASFVYIYLLV